MSTNVKTLIRTSKRGNKLRYFTLKKSVEFELPPHPDLTLFKKELTPFSLLQQRGNEILLATRTKKHKGDDGNKNQLRVTSEALAPYILLRNIRVPSKRN